MSDCGGGLSTVGGDEGGLTTIGSCDGGATLVECCDAPENPLSDGLFVVSLGTMIVDQFGTDLYPDVMNSFNPTPDAILTDADDTPIGSSPLDDTPFILGAGALGAGFGDPYIVFETPVRPPDDDGGLDVTKTGITINTLTIVPD